MVHGKLCLRGLCPCTGKRFDYFTSNRLVAKDPAQLGRLIAAQVHKACFSVKLAFPWDASLLDTSGFPAGRIRYNQAQNVLFSSYMPHKAMSLPACDVAFFVLTLFILEEI